MKKETTCPGCKSDRVVRGRYFNPKAIHSSQAQAPRFKPDGLKHFTLFDPSLAIRGKEKFLACLDCGFLWSHVDPKKLSKSLESNGTDETVKKMQSPTPQEALVQHRCEECDSQRLVLGTTTTTDTPAFRPKGLRFFSFTVSDLKTKQGNRFVACQDCGLLWSGIDNGELATLLTEKGTKKTGKTYRLTTD
ncbi:MAG: hypothetical protein PF692_15075 [Kiritimatiellae bacterium]|jgi:DNA-directed RNA polymerase subunit RPC12/RpoP|nr:hypothetical protein [Kiritimatiellia bacterium]